MNTKDKVIFRKWANGDIIALFPQLPHDLRGDYCVSYEHVGQHGAALASHVIANTTPATPDEYADLMRELETIGYSLRVVRRIGPNDWLHRFNNAHKHMIGGIPA